MREFSKNTEYEELSSQLQALENRDYFICEFFSRHIPKWHNLNPEALILTARSATAYHPLIKRAWQRAYENQKPPHILNIDPRALPGATGPLSADYLTPDSRLLVFDEVTSLTSASPGPIKYEPRVEIDRGNLKESSLEKVAAHLKSFGYKDIWLDWGHKGLLGVGNKALVERKENPKGIVLSKRLNPESRKDALAYSKKMRDLAKLVSELIKNKVL